MNSSLPLLVAVFLVFIKIPSSLSNNDWHSQCGNKFICGSIAADFPFWGSNRPRGCGFPELELMCENDTATIEIEGVQYRVLEISENTEILRIAREDFMNGFCAAEPVNSTLDPILFDYAPGYSNLTFVYGCPSPLPIPVPGTFSCPTSAVNSQIGYIQAGVDGPGNCLSSVFVPVSLSLTSIINMSDLEEDLKRGFEVKWKIDNSACNSCINSRGVCGYDLVSNQSTCYCTGRSNGSNICPPSPDSAPDYPGGKSKGVSLAIGLGIAGAAIAGIGLGCWYLVISQRRKRKAAQTQSTDLLKPPLTNGPSTPTTNLSQISIPSYPYSNSDVPEKGSTYFGVQVFSYSELEEATDHFHSSKELGDGGFGIVYYGVLQDGRVVAVKRLFENNVRRAEQFMNEVEILARLRHKNLVTLYGCTSRRSRELLLVYEYIPNGTVAHHLHGKSSNSGLLTWPLRLSIAIETADALSYLHASDVVHRDVKTNNILLDNNFSVKVADFGLSRLFPNDMTHVSTAPQGTPGYVDPEYYQCYHLTDKSDVYSFGVVLIELLSSLEAVDTSRHRQHINLANMAITKIQNHAFDELVDPCLGFDKDPAVKRMAISVAELAFRCLQQDRDMRPTMKEVLEALKRIEKQDYGVEKAEVVDIREDDVQLLKHVDPPLSPDYAVDDKWNLKMIRTI